MSDTPGLNLVIPDLPLPAVPPEHVRRAALAVCEQARDHDDARMLLDALGLLDGDQLAVLRAARPMWPWAHSALPRGPK